MKVLIGILSIFLITGCAVNFHDDGVCEGMSCKSSIVSRKLNPGTTAMGTVYALPKQLLELKITRKKITKNVLEKEKKGIVNKISKSNKLKTEQQIEIIDVLIQKLKETKISGVLKAKLELELEIAMLDKLVISRTLAKLGNALIKIKKKIMDFQGDKLVDTFKIKPLEPVADNSLIFVATPNTSWWTSESVELKTTAAGLLSGGTGKSEGSID